MIRKPDPKPTAVRFMATCRHCGKPKAVDVAASKVTQGRITRLKVEGTPPWLTHGKCEGCGSGNIPFTNWRQIEGTFSAKRRCDDRCTSAKGHVCVCQCGGANHGSDHL